MIISYLSKYGSKNRDYCVDEKEYGWYRRMKAVGMAKVKKGDNDLVG